MVDHLSDHAKNAIDALSIGVVVGTFIDALPTIAAAASLLWTTLRLIEWSIPRIQRLLRKRDSE